MVVDYTTNCYPKGQNPIRRENPAWLISYVSLFLSWSNVPCLMTAQLLWVLLTFPMCFGNPYKFPLSLAVSLHSIYFTLPKYLLFSFPVLTSFSHCLSIQVRLLLHCSGHIFSTLLPFLAGVCSQRYVLGHQVYKRIPFWVSGPSDDWLQRSTD